MYNPERLRLLQDFFLMLSLIFLCMTFAAMLFLVGINLSGRVNSDLEPAPDIPPPTCCTR